MKKIGLCRTKIPFMSVAVRYILVVVMVGHTVLSRAQSDSIPHLIRGVIGAQNDTTRVDLMIQLGNRYSLANRKDSNIIWYREAVQLSRKIAYNKGETEGLYRLALELAKNGQDNEASQIYEKVYPALTPRQQGVAAYQLCRLHLISRNFKQSNRWGWAVISRRHELLPDKASLVYYTYFLLGQNYEYLHQLDSCKYYLTQAMNLYEAQQLKTDDFALLKLGAVMSETGHYESALQLLQQSLQRARASNNRQAEMKSMINLAEIYLLLENFALARESFQQAEQIGRSIEAPSDRIKARFGMIYAEKSTTSAGILTGKLERILDTLLQIDKADAGSRYWRLAQIQQEAGLYEKALQTYDEGIANARAFNNKNYLANNLIGKGELLVRLKQYSRAYPLLNEARNNLSNWDDPHILSKCLFALGKAEAAIGNPQEAAQSYEKTILLMDSIHQHKQAAITKVNQDLMAQQQEASVSTYENKLLGTQQRIRNLMVLLSAAVLLWASIFAYTYIKRRRAEQQMVALVREVTHQLSNISPGVFDTSGKATQKEQVEKAQHFLREIREKIENTTAELRAFNYTVSHDLKSPLANAEHYLDMLEIQSFARTSEQLPEYLHKFRRLIGEMKQMIEGLSSYTQADNLEMEFQTIHSTTLINSISSSLKETAPNRRIQFDIGELPTLYADPLLLRQVFTNLLGNAAKFTSRVEHPVIRVSGTTTNGFVEIAIADNGAGIPPEGMHRLFQLFKTAHDRQQFEGTGVGLAIVKRIVERHGGTVLAESAGTGKGAVFKVILPDQKSARAWN